MNLESYKYIYFLGIGGIGMSAIARYFNAHGKQVHGYDSCKTKLTEKLEREGILIHYKDDVNELDDRIKEAECNEILVVYTPAIDINNTELTFFKSKGVVPLKRSYVLGIIAKRSFTIAISGTHGKTTTASILTHILKSSKIDCTAFLGGICNNYDSNFVLSKNGNVIIVEADEYDRSFHHLFPDIAIITSVDKDHLDIYGGKEAIDKAFQQFALQVKKKGALIVQAGIKTKFSKPMEGIKLSYSATEEADCYASNIQIVNNKTMFDIKINKSKDGLLFKDKISKVVMGMPGEHNVENVLAACAVACLMGASCSDINNAISTFKGIKRRFEIHIQSDSLTFIDDYAHHPEEVKMTITAVKELYKNKRVMVVFQPHLFTRTQDFADEFAESLSLADELIILEIYPARERPIDGITSNILSEKCTIKNEVCSKEELLSVLQNKKDFEVLLTLGAGDIETLVEPIVSLYN